MSARPARAPLARRDLLLGGAALLAALAADAERRPIVEPVIDTHQHLWDLERLRPPWLAGGGPLARSHLMEEYLREAGGLSIQKTVYMEVDVDPAQHVAEAEYVVGICERPDNPMVAAVVGGRPADPAFADYLARFRGVRCVKGVRQVLHVPSTPRGHCLSDEFVRGVRLLGRAGLSFDVCLPAAYLPDCARLAELCPDTRLVLDHCGNPSVLATDLSQWRRDMDAIARRPNVDCKVSGIVATAKPGAWKPADLAPIVLHCAEAFGRNRIVWASDWPVCTAAATLRQWLLAAKEIVAGWPAGDRRKLFHDNALRVYRLG
ncbi:MAG: amidohydrolase family protein [Chthonomonadales bacterium]|nr:amidohydrolase family protein [Chthonomonadales bacterium]